MIFAVFDACNNAVSPLAISSLFYVFLFFQAILSYFTTVVKTQRS